MFLSTLPPHLENVNALIERRQKAADKKELWRSTYTDAYTYAMPSRETFTWRTEGANKQRQLYDSTLQEATYTSANTLHALLFPPWTHWAKLAPGGAIKPADVTEEILIGLQDATKTFFDFLNSSNFDTVIGEAALDLMVGTAAISFDEGETADEPFKFCAIPLSAIEIEEGPDGKVETKWMVRKPKARDILRLYDGLTEFDLSPETADAVIMKPDKEIALIQGEVYDPLTKRYYGIVIEQAAKHIIWRYDYGQSCPMIVARAMKVAGETYGRGRVLLALPDAKTLDRMQEFILRHAALQIAPPLTGVSDGVFNPYTASLAPNTIIPVASNDTGAPSLRALELGGNFQISETLISSLRDRVRRTMVGPEPSDGAVKSATEISISDRNRLWAMNGEYTRIQSELLDKIVARGIFILQKKGLMPKFKVNGRQVAVTYTSPFAKSQNEEEVMALQGALAIAAVDPASFHLGIRVEDIPAWVFRKRGIDEKLVRSEDEVAALKAQMQQAAPALGAALAQQQGAAPGAAPASAGAPQGATIQ